MTRAAELRVIVVGCDGSPANEAAMDCALDEARRRDARLLVVAAVDYPPTAVFGAGMPPVEFDDAPAWEKGTGARARSALGSAQRRAGGVIGSAELLVRVGHPSVVLLEAAAEADLLIIGARGAGVWERFVVGSTCDEVVRHSLGPVLVVPDNRGHAGPKTCGWGPMPLPEPPVSEHARGMANSARADTSERGAVVVGCDGSPAGEAAMDYAVQEAVRRDARLVVVSAYVYPPRAMYGASMVFAESDAAPRWHRDMQSVARGSLDGALDRAGNPVIKEEIVIREGRPSVVLIEAAAEADLLIIGARGVGVWERLMVGSTCNEVVHHSTGPVLVVPAPRSPSSPAIANRGDAL